MNFIQCFSRTPSFQIFVTLFQVFLRESESKSLKSCMRHCKIIRITWWMVGCEGKMCLEDIIRVNIHYHGGNLFDILTEAVP